MTIRANAQGAATVAAMVLGACASATGGGMPSPVTPVAETVTQLPATSGYRLSNDELGLDCKKLTGRMAVRIVQIRDFQSRSQSTSLSRGIQSAVKPAFGGSGEGSDPDGRYARDRAQLVAYNQRLAEKNCANFDLDAELDPSNKEPPRTRRLKKQ